MKLYFGNTVTTVTTLTILSLLTFIGYSVYYRETVTRWGLRSAVLLVFGLLSAVLRRRATVWTRPYSMPSTAAVLREFSLL